LRPGPFAWYCPRLEESEVFWGSAMAKANSILIKLVSTAGTGYYYTTQKNPKGQTEKLVLKKYDPVVRKHVAFKEAKIK